MIADWIIGLFITVIDFFLSILPDWDTATELLNQPYVTYPIFDPQTGDAINQNSMYALFSAAAKVNTFIPVDHFFAIIGLSAIVFTVVVLYKLARIILGTIRGAGTS